jgi:hypothetical protein
MQRGTTRTFLGHGPAIDGFDGESGHGFEPWPEYCYG